MNEIFLDTETTGLSFNEGHRIVEVACIETREFIPTNRIFHKIINPEREVPNEAFKIHGFSTDFLKTKETFDKIAQPFVEFIKDKKIIEPTVEEQKLHKEFVKKELKKNFY